MKDRTRVGVGGGEAPEAPGRARGSLLTRAALAIAVGLCLYGLAYAYVEVLARRLGDRNPFHQVVTEEVEPGTIVVLGASRALPLAYGDMPAVVERILGRPVLVLAMPGGGVVPNDLVLHHLLERHGHARLGMVLYVADAFAFQSPQWNEARLDDARLWQRAPIDAHLPRALWGAVREHGVAPGVLVNHVTGFWKLNDPTTWFRPDTWEDEAAFDGSHAPSAARDRDRVDYLYPEGWDEQAFGRYRSAFAGLVERVREGGVPFVAVKAPLRTEFREMLPDEAGFDARIGDLLDQRGAAFYDAPLGYGPDLFFDPDHLNRAGVERWLEEQLAAIVERHAVAARGAEPRPPPGPSAVARSGLADRARQGRCLGVPHRCGSPGAGSGSGACASGSAT